MVKLWNQGCDFEPKGSPDNGLISLIANLNRKFSAHRTRNCVPRQIREPTCGSITSGFYAVQLKTVVISDEKVAVMRVEEVTGHMRTLPRLPASHIN